MLVFSFLNLERWCKQRCEASVSGLRALLAGLWQLRESQGAPGGKSFLHMTLGHRPVSDPVQIFRLRLSRCEPGVVPLQAPVTVIPGALCSQQSARAPSPGQGQGQGSEPD